MTAVKKYKGVLTPTAKLTVVLVLVGLVLYPVARMFTSMTAADIKATVGGPNFVAAVKNSLLLTAISTLICLIMALALAWCMERTAMRLKKVFNVILVMPMLIPSISHGMGLIILLGGNGILKNLLGLEGNIYGTPGIILGSVMYAFPVAYIMLADVMRYEDRSVYEAADVLGIGRGRQLLRITLPYLRKPLIATAFSVFAMIITDYGVPLMIGGKTKTLSILMYQEVIGQLNFGRGCVYGAVLLIPAILAFVTDILNKDKASASFVKRDVGLRKNPAREIAAYVICGAVSLFALLPLAAFLLLAFAKSYPSNIVFSLDNVSRVIARGGTLYLGNSLMIALLTALAGTTLGFVAAYITARMKSKLSYLIHVIVLTFMAIPGIVLGLSYVLTFSDSFIYGTLLIMIMVNTAHFLSSPYLMMYNSFGKMNENLEPVGSTLGVGRLRLLRDVFIPQSFGTIAEMFSYIFVNCMMTISAVSFLANVRIRPISLMINQFEAQAQYECAAVVSLFILLANILMKTLIGILKAKVFTKKHQKAATI